MVSRALPGLAAPIDGQADRHGSVHPIAQTAGVIGCD
jgi:hypothetical protein